MDKNEDTDLPTEDLQSKITTLLEEKEHSPLPAVTIADKIQMGNLKTKMVALLERTKRLELAMEKMREGKSDDSDIEDDSEEEPEVFKDCEEIEDL